MIRVTPSEPRPLLALAALLLLTTPALPQAPVRPPEKPQIRLEAVAETRLLMEALNQANFRSLEKTLRDKPADAEGWVFARGQALLIAESANLLMLRAAKNEGREPWLERSRDLREAGVALARALAERDLERARQGLVAVANVCTRCHQTFRVNLKIVPFADPGTRPARSSADDRP